jgi:hypothetical protein
MRLERLRSRSPGPTLETLEKGPKALTVKATELLG